MIMKKRDKYISWKAFIQEIDKCILLIKERFEAKEITDIKSKKAKDWCKYLISQERNIDIRCRVNWYERKDYLANYFRDKTVCLLASLNE